MKKESFQGILLGVVIMCAVFAFITVAWAAFSSTLTIGGTATIKEQSWKVQFTNKTGTPVTAITALTTTGADGNVVVTGKADLTGADFSIDALATTASGNVGTLTQPGDKIKYTWHIENFGTFDANVALTSGVLTSKPDSGSNVTVTCTAKTATTSWTDAKAQAICDKYVKAELKVNSAEPSTTAIVLDKKDGTTTHIPVTLELSYFGSVGGATESGTWDTAALAEGEINVVVSNVVLTATQKTA